MFSTQKLHGILLVLGIAGVIAGCRVCDPDYDRVPPPPAGVHTVTGDGCVEIFWDELHIDDLAGYHVYRSREAYGAYRQIGSSSDAYHVDEHVENGLTYYYAVTAYNWNGFESELSYETVHDTPRPEGFSLFVYDVDELAGIDFSGYYNDMIQPWDDPFVDIYLLWQNGRYCMASRDVVFAGGIYGTDIQYAGYVKSLDEIDWAPEGGWSVETADTVTLYEGHGYLVWTWENNFAKFHVRRIGYDYVVIDWAFQIDAGNPELSILASERGADPANLKEARKVGSDYRIPFVRSCRGLGLDQSGQGPERGRLQ